MYSPPPGNETCPTTLTTRPVPSDRSDCLDDSYIEDDEPLLDRLWAVFGYCSMHCDPLTPESVLPNDFCRLARLCFGVASLQ